MKRKSIFKKWSRKFKAEFNIYCVDDKGKKKKTKTTFAHAYIDIPKRNWNWEVIDCKFEITPNKKYGNQVWLHLKKKEKL